MDMSVVAYLILVCTTLATTYKLVSNYTPQSIYNGTGWKFDPGYYDSYTGQGYMNYVSRSEAINEGIFKIEGNVLHIAAKQNPKGGPPNSVRLITTKSYTGGLWLFDSWSCGPQWPNNGEIDIMEGVNGYGNDLVSLHTSSGCSMTVKGKVQQCSTPNTGHYY
ncbi:hypothetical protein HDV04_000289 [Boothiomyces sp. JEL0838]|nr:hypothetical protein HDV04_000289 [Boothiomyces sp. JEL0838]